MVEQRWVTYLPEGWHKHALDESIVTFKTPTVTTARPIENALSASTFRQAFTDRDCVSKRYRNMAVSPEANTNVSSLTNSRARAEQLSHHPRLLRAIYDLDSIPSCYVPGLTRAKHAIQHATYGAYRHVTGM